MIKKILHDGKIFALVFKKKDDIEIKEGLNFLAHQENNFQLGIIAHPKGYITLPHVHYKTEKKIYDRQEMHYVESGKMKINFLTEDGEKFGEEILEAGDIALLIEGGHGMETLEENTRVVYVKQGPYVSKEADKKVFKE